MTLSAAIKSGKPFRRKTWGRDYPHDWYIVSNKPWPWTPKKDYNLWPFYVLFESLTQKGAIFVIKDIQAIDYETKNS